MREPQPHEVFLGALITAWGMRGTALGLLIALGTVPLLGWIWTVASAAVLLIVAQRMQRAAVREAREAQARKRGVEPAEDQREGEDRWSTR